MTTDYPLEIQPADANALMQQNEDFLLLDVRQPGEFETAAIAGATLIPLGELGKRLSELEPHRERRIIVYCHHGVRSMRAVMGLRQNGFDKAQSLAGGIDLWSQQIDPDVPQY